MPSLGQISRLVILVVAGLVFTTTVKIPAWTLPLIVLDTPLTLTLSSPWLMAAVLVILACTGTDMLFQTCSVTADWGLRRTAPAWVLPGVVAALTPFLIVRFEPLSSGWLLILAGAGIGLSLVLLGEIHAADPADRYCQAARAGLTVLTYAAALIAFTLVYNARVRTALSGTGTSLASFLLAVPLLSWPAGQGGMPGPSAGLRHAASAGSRVWPYAVLTGLLVGMATWGLNRAALDNVAGGGILLLVFYVVTGIAQQFIQRALSWRVVAEFVVAALLGLLLLIGLSGSGG